MEWLSVNHQVDKSVRSINRLCRALLHAPFHFHGVLIVVLLKTKFFIYQLLLHNSVGSLLHSLILSLKLFISQNIG